MSLASNLDTVKIDDSILDTDATGSRLGNTQQLNISAASNCAAVSHRFINVRFTVEDGASLIFDMPETQFGPNGNVREKNTAF